MQMLRHVQAACQGPILRTHSYRLLMLLHYNAFAAISSRGTMSEKHR
jgi:hypothetical protein